MKPTLLFQHSLRIPFLLSFCVLILLGIGSLIFYQERMFFVDPAWVVFNIINDKQLLIAEHRYGAWVTQWVPWLGVHLKLGLKSILILYSFSFYAFYILVGYLVGWRWKIYGLGILWVFYLTLIVSDVYYWPNNEVHQGIGWMFLFLGYYFYRNKLERFTPLSIVLLLTFLFFAISSHLIVGIPLLFLWIFIALFSISKPINYKSTLLNIVFTILIIGAIIIRYKMSNKGWYDPVKLTPLNDINLNKVLQSFSSGQSQTFSVLVLTKYFFTLGIGLTSAYYLVIKKAWWQGLIWLGFSIGYYVLICLVFPEAYDRNLLFYMESEWMAWVIILSTPFVFFMQEKWNTKWATLILLFIFGQRLFAILNSYSFLNDRLDLLETTIAETAKDNEVNKAIIIQAEEKRKEWIMDWGVPIESLLLTTIKHPNKTITIKITSSQEENLDIKKFQSAFDQRNWSTLNPDYFTIDTSSHYILITD